MVGYKFWEKSLKLWNTNSELRYKPETERKKVRIAWFKLRIAGHKIAILTKKARIERYKLRIAFLFLWNKAAINVLQRFQSSGWGKNGLEQYTRHTVWFYGVFCSVWSLTGLFTVSGSRPKQQI